MDIWKHGKYVDTWSVVHFLSGFLLVAVFYMLEYQFTSALGLSILLLIAWEGFEWLTKIIEPSINVVMDIIIGLLGFFAGASLFYLFDKPVEPYFYTALAVTGLLALWGFIDFKIKGYR
jgi:hypothetical protein